MQKRNSGEIRYGRRVIPYRIIRSPRRKKTIALQVSPAGEVVVRAPARTPRRRIEAVAHSRAEWLTQRLAERERGPVPIRTVEFVNGETFLYLGRHYRLRVHRNGSCAGLRVRLTGRYFRVALAKADAATDRRKIIRQAVIAWYRRRAREKIPERMTPLLQKLGLHVAPRVLIRDQTRRWASCSPAGELRFNWRIMMGPISLVDYVIAHELCHLSHRNHSREYWALLGTVLPDYERRQAQLAERGREFDL